MNKKTVLFLIHIPVWMVVLAFVFVIGYRGMNAVDIPFLISSSTIIGFWFLASFYVFYYFLVPKYLEKRKYRQFAMFSTLTVFIILPFIEMILIALNMSILGDGDFSSRNFPSKEIIFQYLGSVAGTLFCGGLGTFYRFGIDWFKNSQIKRELENKNLLSELKTLKSKLNPHFLFNSLNNIDTLIQTNPEQASGSLSKLSDLLRYVVYETENEKVLIQKEIENIVKYVELEKIRLVNPDSVAFKDDITEKIFVPPMIFFPFIENGFKHSNLNNSEHSLTISITSENGKISFNCINTINKKIQKSTEGIGLELARKRLELLYPDSHKLKIERIKNMFHINLEIEPQNND